MKLQQKIVYITTLLASFGLSACGGCGNSCSSSQTCSKGTCKSLSNLVNGDILTFGHYEQDNDTTNGKEPITWRVLDKNAAGQYLVISEKALDAKPYNTKDTFVTWEKSTIRSWLNGYGASYNIVGTDFGSDNFIDAAFTADEKAKIVKSNVEAQDNSFYGTDAGGGIPTVRRVAKIRRHFSFAFDAPSY